MSTSRSPTMDDVAAAAGVSRALVSLVMRNSPKVSDRRRQAVLDAADLLGYRPNAAARSLAEQRSSTVGVVINDLHNPFFADVVDGIHDEATKSGYRLLLSTGWREAAAERSAVENFLENRMDAILLLSPELPAAEIQRLAAAVPIATVSTDVRGVDAVLNDERIGARLATEHLIELGHTDIVHIDGGSGASANTRSAGYVDAMTDAGLTPRVIPGDFSEDSGAAGVELALAERPPTAIFAANDLSAIGAMERLVHCELRIPDDVSLVGYDNTFIAALGHIDLTTVHQPRHEMGRAALQSVLNRMETGRKRRVRTVMSPELRVRGSTAPPLEERVKRRARPTPPSSTAHRSASANSQRNTSP